MTQQINEDEGTQPSEPSNDAPTPPEPPRTPDNRPVGGGGIARMFLPFLLVVLAWMTFSSLGGLTSSVIAQSPFEERCPEAFAEMSTALKDTGVSELAVKTLPPLGFKDSDGSVYVRAEADCTPSYAVITVKESPESAKASLVSAGWEVSTSGPGDFSASKKFGDSLYTVVFPTVEEESSSTAVTVRVSKP